MIKIMFVCHGNICRSPMAEFVMKKIVADNKLADKFLINSSATSTEEIGNGIHRGTKAKLTEMNIPFTSHHAVQITKDDYKNYDYIIAMDSMNLRNLQRIVGFDNEKKFTACLSLPIIHEMWQIHGTQAILMLLTPTLTMVAEHFWST